MASSAKNLVSSSTLIKTFVRGSNSLCPFTVSQNWCWYDHCSCFTINTSGLSMGSTKL